VNGYKVEQFGKARCRAAQSATATGRLDCPHAAHGRRDVADLSTERPDVVIDAIRRVVEGVPERPQDGNSIAMSMRGQSI